MSQIILLIFHFPFVKYMGLNHNDLTFIYLLFIDFFNLFISPSISFKLASYDLPSEAVVRKFRTTVFSCSSPSSKTLLICSLIVAFDFWNRLHNCDWVSQTVSSSRRTSSLMSPSLFWYMRISPVFINCTTIINICKRTRLRQAFSYQTLKFYQKLITIAWSFASSRPIPPEAPVISTVLVMALSFFELRTKIIDNHQKFLKKCTGCIDLLYFSRGSDKDSFTSSFERSSFYLPLNDWHLLRAGYIYQKGHWQ